MIQLINNQNETGGGLAVNITGKYVSNRHAIAKESGKLTAGEAAKILSKILNIKISAKELVAGYKLINGCEPEWHHAGFYKGNHGSTMGRTFFFTNEQIEALAPRWPEIEIKQKEIEIKLQVAIETMIKGFYYSWDYDYSGRYGKKVNYKVLAIYEGNEIGKPRNFTTCTDVEFEQAKSKAGKKYYGWDEPKISEFQNN
jgi:hypothetical protein